MFISIQIFRLKKLHFIRVNLQQWFLMGKKKRETDNNHSDFGFEQNIFLHLEIFPLIQQQHLNDELNQDMIPDVMPKGG